MILDRYAEILIGNVNIKYYLSVGYNVNKGDKVLIDINDLRIGTPVKINVKCDLCGAENKIYLQKYHINKNRCGYYSCVKCSDKKRKIFNNIKYDTDNVSQSEIIKNKKKETTFKNYSVENPSQSKEIKERKCDTMMKNYGVEYVFQSEELRNNMKKTKIEKYGDENFTNRKKSNDTCLEKYGVKNISQAVQIKDKKKETNIKNWGVENVFNSNEIINKIKKTMIKKYGVEYAMQNRDLFIKSKLTSNKICRYMDTNIFYQGSYEKDFLDKYFNKIELNKINKIKYIFDNKIKFYHPDFYFKKLNLIIEIKSDYTFFNELDKNLAKRKYCIEQGYNFIFIINKNYSNFENIVFL